MAIDIRKIKKLIELIDETGIAEIEIREGEESVRISRHAPAGLAPTYLPPPPAQHIFTAPAKTETPTTATEAATPSPVNDPSRHTIKSPMVGTLYLSPSPTAEPFVKIGQHISHGNTLCTIEAMKMFNQIESDKTGTVVECLVENGMPVEFNQPLFVIKVD